MEDYNREEGAPQSSSIKGYKIVIIILAVILAALAFQYYRQVSGLQSDNKELAIERDTLTNRITDLMFEYDNMKTENTSINESLEIERSKADSLLERISKERNLNYAKIRGYEKELGTLRTVMRNFTRQIDSLNTVNRRLSDENVTMRTEVSSQRQRADVAEEKASELNTKIRKGSVIKARNIQLLALNNNDKQVTRASLARRLRVDFVLAANDLAVPGQREIYARITGPDGYIIANSATATFDYEGDQKTYTAKREIDFQNQDIPVGIYYTGLGIVSGKYHVELYMDGYMVGQTDAILK